MKVAYICEPQVGGTFVFFTQLRPLLAQHGIDFRCIPPFNGSLYGETPYEKVDGMDFVPLSEDIPVALGQLVRHLDEQGYNGVLTLPGCHVLGTCLPAYLPAHIGCAAKIPHNGRGTYLPTKEFEPYIDCIAPVNHLLAEDLVQHYKVPENKVRVIYIGIDADHFAYCNRNVLANEARVIYVGRLNDLEKNVCLLPDIVQKAHSLGVDIHCTVIGEGDDKRMLEARVQRRRVESLFRIEGAISYEEIYDRLAEANLFLMPSRFEGCPHALLEAMATGCVPIVSQLRGTLDRIVKNGKNGFLAPVGDASAFARRIRDAMFDASKLETMGVLARETVMNRFTAHKMAEAYTRVFQEICEKPGMDPIPKSLNEFVMPASKSSTWRQWIPMPVKKAVRTICARAGKSI